MKNLVINSGSSSIKYELFNMEQHTVLTSGVLERIGDANSKLKHKWLSEDGNNEEKIYEQKVKDHAHAFDLIRQAMRESKVGEDITELAAVGHRVVQRPSPLQRTGLTMAFLPLGVSRSSIAP